MRVSFLRSASIPSPAIITWLLHLAHHGLLTMASVPGRNSSAQCGNQLGGWYGWGFQAVRAGSCRIGASAQRLCVCISFTHLLYIHCMQFGGISGSELATSFDILAPTTSWPGSTQLPINCLRLSTKSGGSLGGRSSWTGGSGGGGIYCSRFCMPHAI